MIIDSYSVGKLVRLRAVLKPDEKIVARGAILEVAKKEKWEIVVESAKKWLGRVKE
jgi:flagellar biosynthesis regulator FlbT